MKQKPRGIILACLLVTSLSTFRSPAQTTNGTQAGDGARTKLPELLVTEDKPVESRPGWLQEEQPIGENQQPEWTTRRRFSTTRVYVISPWQMEFEQWWKGKFLRDGKTEHLFQSEVEIGLPYRFPARLLRKHRTHSERNLASSRQPSGSALGVGGLGQNPA